VKPDDIYLMYSGSNISDGILTAVTGHVITRQFINILKPYRSRDAPTV
jgi:hypothetical protein